MTSEMREFLTELADLIERHGVELTAVDDGVDYYPSVDGVEVIMMSKYDDNGDTTREYCEVKTGLYLYPDSLRKMASSDA